MLWSSLTIRASVNISKPIVSNIVQNKHFESGLLKLQQNRSADLEPREKEALKPFENTSEETSTTPIILDPTSKSLGKSILHNYRHQNEGSASSAYKWFSIVPPTSNRVERLFSKCRLILTHLRKRMKPKTLEILLYLQFYRERWSPLTIKKIRASDPTNYPSTDEDGPSKDFLNDLEIEENEEASEGESSELDSDSSDDNKSIR